VRFHDGDLKVTWRLAWRRSHESDKVRLRLHVSHSLRSLFFTALQLDPHSSVLHN
jgi:hypothetical protein